MSFLGISSLTCWYPAAWKDHIPWFSLINPCQWLLRSLWFDILVALSGGSNVIDSKRTHQPQCVNLLNHFVHYSLAPVVPTSSSDPIRLLGSKLKPYLQSGTVTANEGRRQSTFLLSMALGFPVSTKVHGISFLSLNKDVIKADRKVSY